MKHLTLALLAIAVIPTVYAAEPSEKALSKCVAINDGPRRLACFDVLTKPSKTDQPTPAATKVKSAGKWTLSTDIDPIDDAKSFTLMLKADSGESEWRIPYHLVAKCSRNKTSAYIAWSEYLGISPTIEVKTRFGKAVATSDDWGPSADSDATFHPTPIEFLKKMLTESRLVAQVTPHEATPVTAIFDLTGLDSAISPLRENCNW